VAAIPPSGFVYGRIGIQQTASSPPSGGKMLELPLNGQIFTPHSHIMVSLGW
jgi:hypothetical protein